MRTYWDQRLLFQPPGYFLPYSFIIVFPKRSGNFNQCTKDLREERNIFLLAMLKRRGGTCC